MEENLPLLKTVIKLRRELAGLLGYDSHAAFRLSDNRMCSTAEEAITFLKELRTKVAEVYKRMPVPHRHYISSTPITRLRNGLFPFRQGG
jgi:Zn-dependent oligopeptidase